MYLALQVHLRHAIRSAQRLGPGIGPRVADPATVSVAGRGEQPVADSAAAAHRGCPLRGKTPIPHPLFRHRPGLQTPSFGGPCTPPRQTPQTTHTLRRRERVGLQPNGWSTRDQRKDLPQSTFTNAHMMTMPRPRPDELITRTACGDHVGLHRSGRTILDRSVRAGRPIVSTAEVGRRSPTRPGPSHSRCRPAGSTRLGWRK